MIEIRKAQRSNKPLKLGMKGPSGCGKTYSALRFAVGLVQKGKRVVLIDTQWGQSEMYDQAFDFDVICISSESTGAQYQEAMEAILKVGNHGVVIIDSLSHDWESVISDEAKIPSENMKSWSVAKQQTGHTAFLKYLWGYPFDVICTIRCDESFEIGRDERGKITKRKVGFKPIQQPRIEYDFDIVFDIEPDTHIATAQEFGKNHTPLWQGEKFMLTEEHGKVLRDWKHGGSEWVEPIRTGTRKNIERYIVSLGWRKLYKEELAKHGYDKTVPNMTEVEAQELLEFLTVRLSKKETKAK